MVSSAVATRDVEIRHLPDEIYYNILKTACEWANRRIYASVFLVDSRISDSRGTKVHWLIEALGRARLRGVDVKTIIGGSRETPTLLETAEVAKRICDDSEVPCKVTARYGTPSHKKLVVVDDRVLIGSHNWSEGAFSGQTQDSVMVSCPCLADYLAEVFLSDWTAMREE
jgi:phosphatidylserine/phosphatidylglycerophosphate/cardiolipin synthase-like enzyme